MRKYLFFAAVATVLVSCSKPEAPVPVEGIDPNTVIEYTSYNGTLVEPYNYDYNNYDTTTFGAIIVSNTCKEGMINSPGTIKFDRPVTHIGDKAFYNRSLSSIVIPDTVTSIGDYAFCGTPLSKVTLPNSIVSIGREAFLGANFTSIALPSSVASIGAYAFAYTTVSGITLPDSITVIDEGTFYCCLDLYNIIWGNNIQTIGDKAFYFTDFSFIEIPDSVTSIGETAFGNCVWLGRVVLGKGVKTIGKNAFGKCKRLLEVYCKSQEPPVLGSETALGDPQNSVNYKIYVPHGAVDAYKSAWSIYSEYIVGYDSDTI